MLKSWQSDASLAARLKEGCKPAKEQPICVGSQSEAIGRMHTSAGEPLNWQACISCCNAIAVSLACFDERWICRI